MRGVGLFVLLSVWGSVRGEPQHEGRKVENAFHKDGEDPHGVEWIGDNKASSNHLVHANKWGRDPEVSFLLDSRHLTLCLVFVVHDR